MLATMASSALPRPSAPPHDPPTTALPPLPVQKTRKSLPAPSTRSPALAQGPLPQTPSRLAIRLPSAGSSLRPGAKIKPSTVSSPAVPTVGKRAQELAVQEQTLKKAISIPSFLQTSQLSQITKTSTRITAVPGRKSLGINTDVSPAKTQISDLDFPIPPSPGLPKPKRLKSQQASASLHGAYSTPAVPSTLNSSSGNNNDNNNNSSSNSNSNNNSDPISSTSLSSRQSGSDGLNSQASPPRSRSSSTAGSYSTGATTFEEDETSQATQMQTAGISDEAHNQTPIARETKGNVVVSVRVRPQESGDGSAEGEWMVDGRTNLVAYRGKEGGDYFYGALLLPRGSYSANFAQTMYSLPGMTTARSTILQPDGSSGE